MMMNENSMYCVYMTPCKYCAKFDKWCEKKCRSKKSAQSVANNAVAENIEKNLNPAGEYAVKFAKNHGMSVAEAMGHPMVKARFNVFNETGM